MRHTRIPRRHQRKFAFATVDLWDKLPEQKRETCQELVTELLRRVLRDEEKEGNSHEREN